MAVLIPQTSSEDRAAGGLRADASTWFGMGLQNATYAEFLTRTMGDGNRRTYTLSGWYRRTGYDNMDMGNGYNAGHMSLFGANDFYYQFGNSYNDLKIYDATSSINVSTKAMYWDTQWYHIFVAVDTTQSTNTDRVKIYVNGKTITRENETFPSQNAQGDWNNSSYTHYLMRNSSGSHYDGFASQVYHIDGQALEPGEFGYTDELTGQWRPKKFTGSYDASALTTNPTGIGGYPILNTNGSGGEVTSGYRTDKNPSGTDVSSYLVLAIPGNGGSIADVSADVKGSGSNKTITLSGGDPVTSTTQSAFYGKSVHLDGNDDFTCGSGSDYAVGTSDFTAEGWFWFNSVSSSQCLMEWDNNSSATGSPSGRSDGGQWYFSSGGNKLHWYQNSSTYCDNSVTPPVQTWCHMAVVVTGGTMKMYIDGEEKSSESYSLDLGNSDGNLRIGLQGGTYFDGYINDFRFYKGVAKYTAAFIPAPRGSGTNSFYLPLDGSGPIGDDQSGKGNSFTPNHLGNTVTIDRATGALPIRNTKNGGTSALPGVRGSIGVGVSVYNSKYYLDGEEAKTVKFIPGQTVTFDTSDTTVGGHPFRLSGISNGAHADDYYSVDFDGTGDYLSITESTDWLFEEGDFTVEFWAYIDNIATNGAFVTNMQNFNTASQYDSRWVIGLHSSELRVWLADDGSHVLHDYNPPQQQWVHYALTRETGNRFTLYKNGLNISTATHTSDMDTNGDLQIGYLLNLGDVDAKIADLRIVKGTAVYTSNFQPPITSLTNITNTKVLCCNSSTTTGYTVSPGTITANGDPTSSNDNPYDTYTLGTVTGAISEGTAGAATTITIPTNAPSNLYYYCTNHSGMGGTVSIGATNPRVADPYASANVVALPLTQKAMDWSDQVNCTHAKHSISISGAVAKNYRSVFYGGSYYFDGSNDEIEIASHADSTFGTGDFTWELWFYPLSIGGYVMDMGTGDQGSLKLSSNNIYYNTATITNQNIGQIRAKRWTHVAVSRVKGTTHLFLDGNLNTSISDTSDWTSTYKMVWGNSPGGGNAFNGYISDVRIYKGVGKYTKSFLPASTHPSVMPETPSGSAYPSNTSLEPSDKVKGASVDFDGASFLRIPAHADYQFGTGDYTVEMWVYPTHLQSNRCLFDLRSATGSTQNGFSIVSDGEGQLSTYSGGGYLIQSGSQKALVDFQWSHILISHVSGTQYMFIDGKLKGTTTTGYSYTEGRLSIGADANDTPSEFWKGKISNVRVIKGSGLYTADFTPPTEPLTTTSQGATASEVKFLGCNSAASPTLANPSAKIAGVNDGRSWSQGVSCAGGFWSTYPAVNIFNTIVSDAGRAEARKGDTPINIDFIPAVSVSTHLKIWSGKSSTRYQINDSGSYTTYSDAVGSWKTIHSGSLTLSNLKIMHGVAGNAAGISAIDIDGTTLVDPIPGHRDVEVSYENPFDDDTDYKQMPAQHAWVNPFVMDNSSVYTWAESGFGSADIDRVRCTGPTTFMSSVPMTKGKWYCEVTSTAHGSTHMGIGISKVECVDGNRQPDEGQHRGGWAVWHISGDGSYRKIGYGASWGSQSTSWEDWGQAWGYNGHWDCMGLALDMDNRTLDYYKNGENMGTYENMIGRTIYWGEWVDAANDNGTILKNTSWADGDHGMVFVMGNGQSGATADFEVNFGQRPFRFAPPPGYQAASLVSTVSRPTVIRSDIRYFSVTGWTGDGTNNREISFGCDLQPDLIWYKERSEDRDWQMYDTVRGVGPAKNLVTNTDYAETANDDTSYGYTSSFNRDGFTVTNGSSGGNENIYTNKNGQTYVCWGWRAGGSKGTWNLNGDDVGSLTAAGLNYGDTSVLNGASVNTEAGFSIVKWTQDSGGSSKNIAHGLTRAPNFIIMKHLNSSSNFYVSHNGVESTSGAKILYMNKSTSEDISSDFGSSWPTSTYTATATTGVNGRTVIMYSWHDVEGVQKFGQFEGNGQSSAILGPYIYLGFKPALLFIKRVDASSHNWFAWDNVIDKYNRTDTTLKPNTYGAEDNSASYYLHFKSDGFKIANSTSSINNAGSKYIYCAWASSPFTQLYGANTNPRTG